MEKYLKENISWEPLLKINKKKYMKNKIFTPEIFSWSVTGSVFFAYKTECYKNLKCWGTIYLSVLGGKFLEIFLTFLKIESVINVCYHFATVINICQDHMVSYNSFLHWELFLFFHFTNSFYFTFLGISQRKKK